MPRKHRPKEIISKLREAEIALAQRIWWPEDGSGPANERTGARESPVAARGVGSDDRQVDPAEGLTGKLLGPARCKRCIDHIRTMMPVFERRMSPAKIGPKQFDHCCNVSRHRSIPRWYRKSGLVTVLRRSPISLCHLSLEFEGADAAQI